MIGAFYDFFCVEDFAISVTTDIALSYNILVLVELCMCAMTVLYGLLVEACHVDVL